MYEIQIMYTAKANFEFSAHFTFIIKYVIYYYFYPKTKYNGTFYLIAIML